VIQLGIGISQVSCVIRVPNSEEKPWMSRKTKELKGGEKHKFLLCTPMPVLRLHVV